MTIGRRTKVCVSKVANETCREPFDKHPRPRSSETSEVTVFFY